MQARTQLLTDITREMNSLSYEQVLARMNRVERITDTDDQQANVKAMHEFLDAFMELLHEHFHAKIVTLKTADTLEKENTNKKELISIINQLEAIAFLTGHISIALLNPIVLDIYKYEHLEQYRYANFLRFPGQLKFYNFDRQLLVLQLMLRVLKPSYIQQSSHQICGPTAFMQTVANNNPLAYVKYVTDLAEHGKTIMQLGSNPNGIVVDLANSNLFNQPSKLRGGDLHEADLIAQAGLRESQNIIFSFVSSKNMAARSMFGVTRTDEMEGWMALVGYHHVQKNAMSTPQDIQQINKLLNLGYEVLYCTTGNLTEAIFNNDFSRPPGIVDKLTRGHVIWLNKVEYLKQSNQVKISITSWGRDTKDVMLSYDDFLKFCGGSITCLGISPQAENRLQATARLYSYDRRVHPYEFCRRVKAELTNLLKQPNINPEIRNLLSLLHISILENIKALKEDSWVIAAKKLQDEILGLGSKDEYYHADFQNRLIINRFIKEYCEYAIISEKTIKPANDILKILIKPDASEEERNLINLNNIHFKKIDQELLQRKGVNVENLLTSGIELEDIDAIKLLIQYYFSINRIDKAFASLTKSIDYTWANMADNLNLQKTFADALREKILTSLAPNIIVSAQQMAELNQYTNRLEPTYQKIYRPLLQLLEQRKLSKKDSYEKSKINLLLLYMNYVLIPNFKGEIAIEQLEQNIDTNVLTNEIADLINKVKTLAKENVIAHTFDEIELLHKRIIEIKERKNIIKKDFYNAASLAYTCYDHTYLLLTEICHIIPADSALNVSLNIKYSKLNKLNARGDELATQYHLYITNNKVRMNYTELADEAIIHLQDCFNFYIHVFELASKYLNFEKCEYYRDKIISVFQTIISVQNKTTDMGQIQELLNTFKDILAEANLQIADTARQKFTHRANLNPAQLVQPEPSPPSSTPAATSSSQAKKS